MGHPDTLSRRAFLHGAGLAALAAALAGCAPRETRAVRVARQTMAALQPAVTPQPTAGPVRLTYGFPQGAEWAPLQAQLRAFSESGQAPNVEVSHQAISGDYPSRLRALAAGGLAPDVHLQIDQDIPSWARLGLLLRLEPFLVSDPRFDLADFDQAHLSSARHQGQLWALPWCRAGTALFINRDLFQAAQVPLPPPGWTWNELKAAAVALTSTGRGQWGCGAVNGWWQMEERVWQNGAEAFDPGLSRCLLDQPAAIEAIEFWVDLALKDGAAPEPGAAGRSGIGLFLGGRLAMYEEGVWLVAACKEARFAWDIAPLPRQRRAANVLWSGSQAIGAHTAHPQEAWALLKHLTGTQALEAFARALHVLPARQSARARKPYIDPGMSINWDLVPQTVESGRLPESFQSDQVAPLLEELVVDTQRGSETVREAVARIVPQINALLAQEPAA